jgi:hypothetical protein
MIEINQQQKNYSSTSSSSSALPAPWEEHYSDTHQIPYYYNPVTGASSWEFPIMPSPGPSSSTKLTRNELTDERLNNTITELASLNSSFHDHEQADEEEDEYSIAMSQSSQQTSVTNSTSTSQRVEDNLLRKGQSYLHRREELKREYDERIQAEHTGKPQLSKYTEKIYANKSSSNGIHSLPIGERTKILLERKRMKEEALKREIEERRNQEV